MKPKVAFICVHNACRSQIAEAISKIMASDVFEAYSAGTQIKPYIDQTAVTVVKERYGININETQASKLIDTLPPVDVVITMGCNVSCPSLPCQYREDWGLEDPTGKTINEYVETAKIIEEKITALKTKIKTLGEE